MSVMSNADLVQYITEQAAKAGEISLSGEIRISDAAAELSQGVDAMVSLKAGDLVAGELTIDVVKEG